MLDDYLIGKFILSKVALVYYQHEFRLQCFFFFDYSLAAINNAECAV